MSSVPYIFANSTGNIALSQLDVNFANVKSQVDAANVVTDAAQPAITTVGTLNGLAVDGPVIVDTGPILSGGNINLLTGTLPENYTQMQWAEDINNPGVGKNQYIWVDTDGAHIQTIDTGYNNIWEFNNAGNTVMPGNASIAGSATVTGNLRVTGIATTGAYTKAQLLLITGRVGSIVAVIDSPVHAGKLAYWDGTYSRWSYVKDDSAI